MRRTSYRFCAISGLQKWRHKLRLNVNNIRTVNDIDAAVCGRNTGHDQYDGMKGIERNAQDKEETKAMHFSNISKVFFKKVSWLQLPVPVVFVHGIKMQNLSVTTVQPWKRISRTNIVEDFRFIDICVYTLLYYEYRLDSAMKQWINV